MRDRDDCPCLNLAVRFVIWATRKASTPEVSRSRDSSEAPQAAAT